MLIHNPQDVHRLRAQIAGWLAVEPNRHIADSLLAGMLRERVEPVPAPVPRRQRKRSLTTILRQARNAGADRVEYGEAVIHLTGNGSPATPVEAESDVNEWEGEPA
jgi:hypothetical protein